MNSEAFAIWSSLFDEEMKNVWLTECKEFKCAAMALHALKKELKKIENVFDLKLNSYKKKLLNQNSNKTQSVKRKIFPIANITDVSLPIGQEILDSSIKSNIEISELDQAISGVDIESSDNDCTKIPSPTKSPKITKNMNISKKRKVTSHLTPSVLNFNARSESKTSIDSNTSLNLLHMNNTPNEPVGLSDYLDSSIIESTPVVLKNKKGKKREVSKTVPSKNATLTQMFGNETITQIESNNAPEPIASAGSSDGSMYIDEILDYINQENPLQVQKGGDVAMGSSRNNKNRFPIEKRNSPNYLYKPETVRGKARMELPGWSCKQCRDFYEALGLSPEELKVKMDECSKHRSKFAPVDDTPPGFWDMTLPTTPSTFYE